MQISRSIVACLILLGSMLTFPSFAQMDDGPLNPVAWSVSTEDLGGNEFDIVFRGEIEKGWYVYSQISFGDMGPIPTTILFEDNDKIELVGGPRETGEKVVEGHDDIFDMTVKKFKGWAEFRQKVKVVDPSAVFTGQLDYMTCDDEQCIFPDPMYFRGSLDNATGQIGGLEVQQGSTSASNEGGPSHKEGTVLWTIDISESSSGEYKAIFNAKIDEGWYLYSQNDYGEGPMPTTIAFDALDHITPFGEPKETGEKVIEGHDEIFDMNVKKFKYSADFERMLKVTDIDKEITGQLDFMSCDDGQCIFPPPLFFSFNIKTGQHWIGMEKIELAEGEEISDSLNYKLPNVDLENPIIAAVDDGAVSRTVKGTSSLWKLFFLGFIGGLVALLTPCVFPMIPLTVSFFTKGSEDKAKGTKNAIIYGLFIFLIYVAFSIPFHVAGSVSPEIFNEISTNSWLNIFFFVIFIVFAISFFGYFEITLPSSFVNKMDSNASKYGGLIGIFFMALTLALVSFSCTGPILGSLLAGAITSTGGAWQLTMGLAGFGLALALPFALFAMFPRWLNSLPSSGGWLNSVKVVLGFAEVALAFKFLSNADLVEHWGIVRYELFMAIWVLCALGIVLYLFGKIKFPHDSPLQKISGTRWAFITLFAAATIYFSLGFRYWEENKTFTPMALMSGLAPPVGYSWIFPKECPSNLNCYKDLEEGMAAARETGKPIMLDFTGYACVNCRKMEEHVWPKDPVYDLINENYVLVSLYVDDKAELPEDEQHVYETTQGQLKRIGTKGNKWSTVQTETFINNSQPYYALLSPDGYLLTDPVSYTPDLDEYSAFLERGLKALEKHQNGDAALGSLD